MAASGDPWVREYNEAVKLVDDINNMISERSSFPTTVPEAQRHLFATRRKITKLRTRLDNLQALLSELPGKQSLTEKEMNHRRDMVANLRSKVIQMSSTLNMSNFANRDNLLGPEIKPADAMSRATGIDNQGIVGLQGQIMREQDEGLEKLEETVISTKHIALVVNEELDRLHTRLSDNLDEHVNCFDTNEEEDERETHENGDKSDEDDCADYVCSICDNGGGLLICEGKCMRSFHATVKDGIKPGCESLGFTDAEVQAMKNVAFYCENCRYKKHQCFACGELGSSDESSNPEVFCCVKGACGFFYHPHCVAKLLHPWDSAAAEELQQRIGAGEPFACPAHRCHACKELEVRSIVDLQFAVCRRCPRAYHRKCLPREITSEKDVDMERGTIQRAWTGLIPNRILIYCLDHEIDPDILTTVRDHIKFPGPR